MKPAFLFLLATVASTCLGGQLRFSHLNLLDGLPDESINCMLQDKAGYLWLGTQNGLARYDGYEVAIYKADPELEGSMVGLAVSAMLEDMAGTFWVATPLGGLQVLDRDTGTFSPAAKPEGFSKQWSDLTIQALFQDGSGTLWVGGKGGLVAWKAESGYFRHYQVADGLCHDDVRVISQDKAGGIWIGTANGLNLLSGSEPMQKYRHDPLDPNSISSNEISSILEDDQGTLWIGAGALFGRSGGGGLNRLDRETGHFTHYRTNPDNPASLSHDNVTTLLQGPGGQLWVGTGGSDVDGGLNIFDPKSGDWLRLPHDQDDPSSLSHNRILCQLQDRAGAVWIGTWYGGVNIYDPGATNFDLWQYEKNNPASLLAGNFTSTLLEDRSGNLWIGGWSAGLSRLRPDGKIKRWQHEQNGLGSSDVQALLENPDGSFWIGSYGGGLDRLDPKTGRFSHIRHNQKNSNGLSSNDVCSLFRDSQQRIWVGTFDGLDIWRPESGEWRHVACDTPNGPVEIGVYQVLEAGPDDFWVTTRQGNVFRYRGGSLSKLNSPQKGVTGMVKTSNGQIWLSTSNDGIKRWLPDSETFFTLARKHGLPHDRVWGLLADDRDTLWLTTPKGLTCYEPASGKQRNYDVPHQMRLNQMPAHITTRRADGQLLFAGSKGVLSFYPKQLKANVFKPPVVLTDVTVNFKPLGHDRLRESLVLPYAENDVSFGFTALSFRKAQQNHYSYFLENYDVDWREPSTLRSATYTNLPPGSYRFLVKGSNNDRVWNEQPTALTLIIQAPWWRTIWARLLFGATFLAALFGLVRWRLAALEKRAFELESVVQERTRRIEEQKQEVEAANRTIGDQAQELRELDKVKTNFFTNISHELRTPLTLILGPVRDIMEGTHGPLSEAVAIPLSLVRRNAARLLELINQLLDLSKLDAGAVILHAREQDLVVMLKGVVYSFASMAEAKQIQLSFETEIEVLAWVFDRDKLEKILVNLLANAFKFTPDGGRIRVRLERGASSSGQATACIRVKDTGIGISREEQKLIFERYRQSETRGDGPGTGIGLALTQELVHLHGGEVTVASEPDFGSEFLVTLARLKPTESAVLEAPEPVLRPVDLEGATTELERDDGPKRYTVLIVEDHEDVRLYLRMHLQQRYQVLESANGQEALELARARQPDLIISDVMMPVMDGYTLCHILKSDAKLVHIPVILLTARVSPESKLKGLERGADDYLLKPFDAAELSARAENLIEIRRRLREKFSGEVTLMPTGATLQSADAALLARIKSIIEEHMGDSGFGVEELAGEVGLSARQLHRKCRASAELSTSGLIRMMRLQRAAQILGSKAASVSETAYQVGFSDVAYFSKLFRQAFGCPPSQVTNLGSNLGSSLK